MPMSDFDVLKIAGLLSGQSGTFQAENLVNYGQTVIVKPGATTVDGESLSGEDVQRMLGSGYQVFPLAVEYKPSLRSGLDVIGSTETDSDITSLENDLATFGDEFGRRGEPRARKSAHMKKRYLKVYAKFEKCKTLLDEGKGLTKLPVWTGAAAPFIWLARSFRSKDRKLASRAKNCDKLYDRLVKVYDRMKAKGVDVSDLPDPRQIPKSMYQSAASSFHRRPRRRDVASPVAAPQGQRVKVITRYVDRPVYVREESEEAQAPVAAPQPPKRGGYTPVSQEYLRDQAALERELQTPEYGSDLEELAGDLRGSCSGYLYGIEHDYFGASDLDDASLTSDDDDDDDLSLIEDLDDEDDGEDGELGGLPGDDSDLVGAVADEDLGADDELGADDDDLDDDSDLDDDDEDAPGEDDDSDILAMMGGDDEQDEAADDEDDFVSDLERLLSIDGAVRDREAATHETSARTLDSDIVRRDGALKRLWANESDHGPGSTSDLDRLLSIEEGVREREGMTYGSASMGRQMGHLERLMLKNPENATRRLAKLRSNLERKLDEKVRKGAPVKKVQRLQSRIAKTNALLARGSANQGVDYGRIQPRSPSSEGAPVLVIAIRKRESSGRPVPAGSRSQDPRSFSLMDVFAADLANTAAFPEGSGAPLPGPRQIGREVYG